MNAPRKTFRIVKKAVGGDPAAKMTYLVVRGLANQPAWASLAPSAPVVHRHSFKTRVSADVRPAPAAAAAPEIAAISQKVTSEEMTDREAAERLAEGDVDVVIPSIPFSLVEPVSVTDSNCENEDAWGLSAIGALESELDGHGVTVAILDTGIKKDHEAFAHLGTRMKLMDFTQTSAGGTGVPDVADDIHGHGTHVAGTIVGDTVQGKRVGIAPRLKRVLIGKVLGPKASSDALFNGIDWALRNNADIISFSLGIDFPGLVKRLTEQNGFPPAIAASRALVAYQENVRFFERLVSFTQARPGGALFVAAAGNESKREVNPLFTVAAAPPAAAEGFTAIGAVMRAPKSSASFPFSVAAFSNTGCRLCAPGVSILSARHDQLNGLKCMSGTSMATPHVAGAMALWIQKLFESQPRPARWTEDVLAQIGTSVIKAPPEGRNDFGLGLVQCPKSK